MAPEFLDTIQAATLLNVSERYMKKLRHFGRGPKFSTLDGGDLIRYLKSDLLAYAKKMQTASDNRWPKGVDV